MHQACLFVNRSCSVICILSLPLFNTGSTYLHTILYFLTFAGTFFYLLEDSAHPCLSLSEDGLTIFYGEEELPISALASDENTFSRWSAQCILASLEIIMLNDTDTSVCVYRCVAVLGNLIPVRGRHYWEVEVDEATEFRIGVAYEDTERNSYLGANNTSWCMRHILTPTR